VTSQTVLFILGGILIVVGILGGGFEVKELKIPQVAGAARILSLIVGIALLGVGFKVEKTVPSQPETPRVAAPSPQPAPAPTPTPTVRHQIIVTAGTYGRNCNTPYGNVTAHLASQCNGRATCSYTIDYQIIGDPAQGCAKGSAAMTQQSKAHQQALRRVLVRG